MDTQQPSEQRETTPAGVGCIALVGELEAALAKAEQGERDCKKCGNPYLEATYKGEAIGLRLSIEAAKRLCSPTSAMSDGGQAL